MTGMLVLVVLLLWVLLLLKLASWIGQVVPAKRWRTPVTVLAFVLMLALPLADEIVGGFQFRALCKREAVVTIDAEKVRGRTLKRLGAQLPTFGAAVPIERFRIGFVDPATGEELASYVWLRASGGWLMRSVPLPQGPKPLLIERDTCRPDLGDGLEKKYHFTLLPD